MGYSIATGFFIDILKIFCLVNYSIINLRCVYSFIAEKTFIEVEIIVPSVVLSFLFDLRLDIL